MALDRGNTLEAFGHNCLRIPSWLVWHSKFNLDSLIDLQPPPLMYVTIVAELEDV